MLPGITDDVRAKINYLINMAHLVRVTLLLCGNTYG